MNKHKPIKHKETGKYITFYGYKEPLVEVKKKDGHGYMGVVLSTLDGNEIQCHVCGKLYGDLSKHLATHKITAEEYREKYQLSKRTVLCSESIRMQRRETYTKWFFSLSKEEQHRRRKAMQANAKRGIKTRAQQKSQPKLSLEDKNKRGTCPDQLLQKIKDAKKDIGHVPSKNEFIDYCKSQRYVHIIYATFGSWAKAVKLAGFKPRKSNENFKRHLKKGETIIDGKSRSYDPEILLEYLRLYYEEHKRVPTHTDCRRGLIPDGSVYIRHFGSLPEARRLAGIDEDPRGRWGSKKELEAMAKK